MIGGVKGELSIDQSDNSQATTFEYGDWDFRVLMDEKKQYSAKDVTTRLQGWRWPRGDEFITDESKDVLQPSGDRITFSVDPLVFRQNFVRDREKALAKYRGNYIESVGKVSKVSRTTSPDPSREMVNTIVLEDIVNFVLPNDPPWSKVSRGGKVKIVGRCESIWIMDCELLEVQGDPVPVLSPYDLAREYGVDRRATDEKYDGQQLIIEGVVVAREEDGTARITLHGGADGLVACNYDKFNLAPQFEPVQPGQYVRVLGEYDRYSSIATLSESVLIQIVTTRQWRNQDNEPWFEAALVKVAEDEIQVRRSDGVEATIPISRLSTRDQQIVASIQWATKDAARRASLGTTDAPDAPVVGRWEKTTRVGRISDWELKLSGDGRRAVCLGDTTDSEQMVRLWNLDSNKLQGEFTRSSSRNYSPIAISPNGELVTCIAADSRIEIRQFEDAKVVFEVDVEILDVRKLAVVQFARSGKLIYALSVGGEVLEVNVQDGNCKLLMKESISTPTKVAFWHDDSKVAVGNDNGQICILDLEKKATIHSFSAYRSSQWIKFLSVSHDGKWIASSTLNEEDKAKIWDAHNSRELVRYISNNSRGVAFLPDGKTIVVPEVGAKYNRPDKVYFWDVRTGKKVGILSKDKDHDLDSISNLRVSDDGKRLVILGSPDSGGGNVLQSWNLELRKD